MRYTVGLVMALLLAGPAAAGAKVSAKVEDGYIDFLAGDVLVGRYHTDPKFAKPIFWPLKVGGVGVTRDWPMQPLMPGGSTDHPHQKSAWFCHGDVIPEGIDLKDKLRGVAGVDFWSEAKGHGRIVRTKTGIPKIEGFGVHLPTHNEWRTADGTKIMDEDRVVRLYALGKARLIVFSIDLHASVCPITFGDTKEGCMGVRINDAIRADKTGKGTIENAEGQKGEKNCRTTHSAWMDYSGPIDGNTVGLTIFDDPKNLHPAFWHVRGYGLMAANPFARKHSEVADDQEQPLMRLAKGEHLRLRYGILLHEGDATGGHVAGYFERFVKLRERE
jgi:hypothetical protein